MNKLETIRSLPDSGHLELIKAINQLSLKAGQIDQVLETFDQITQTQRASIQALAEEISQQATSTMQQQLLMLASKTDNLDKTLGQVNKSAEFLEKAQKPIGQAVWKMHEAAEAIQHQPWWRLLAVAAAAAILSALLVVGGMHGLKQLQPKPVDIQAMQLWERATPAERELIMEIYNR